MQSDPLHSGDLSQESLRPEAHRTGVAPSFWHPYNDDVASKRTRQMYQALSASSVGLELGISVLIGLLGGIWLDGQFGTEPWLMLLCLAFGLIAGFRGVLRAVARSDRAAAREAAHG